MQEFVIPAITSFVTTMAVKGAEAPANTFSLVWKQVFGPLDIYLEKKNIVRQQELSTYAASIENHVLNIPTENLQEPDMSILGPALEASKFYISKETIRELFARIVAASFDNRKNDFVHHSYIEIVKQLSTDDTKTILFLKNTRGLLRLKEVSSFKGFQILEPLVLSQLYSNINKTAISLINLERLGLINLDFQNKLNKETMYEEFFKSETYKNYENNLMNGPLLYKDMFSYIEEYGREKAKIDLNLDDYTIDYSMSKFHIEADYGSAYLTAFGESFFEICCS